MTQNKIGEVRELLFQIERRMRPLEWDLNRNQINEFKKKELARLKEQHNQLQHELTQLIQPPQQNEQTAQQNEQDAV
ncbi:hypothetical protein J4210_06090 [Candidatus Woesearchaeota archaeon]|nr:hypothetical protein [Candidatus Woesearchaeota archaeon]